MNRIADLIGRKSGILQIGHGLLRLSFILKDTCYG
jgi:hypothetical protein